MHFNIERINQRELKQKINDEIKCFEAFHWNFVLEKLRSKIPDKDVKKDKESVQ